MLCLSSKILQGTTFLALACKQINLYVLDCKREPKQDVEPGRRVPQLQLLHGQHIGMLSFSKPFLEYTITAAIIAAILESSYNQCGA